jgi:hypothetical protein
LIALVITGVLVLVLCVLVGGWYARGAMKGAHLRREESEDVHRQAHADFIKLGEGIGALDIDSSLANASAQGKDEYGHAVGCYAEAERRLKNEGDDYQFQKALNAIKAGFRHLNVADQLFNPTRDPRSEVEQLSKLAELHRRGTLTDAEFAAQKAKLIN